MTAIPNDKYVSAVNGRKEFRDAYRQERQRRMALEAELTEIRELAPAHRAVVPVVTMQAISAAICSRAEELQGKNLEGVDPHDILLLTGGQLNRIIMQVFDKELG